MPWSRIIRLAASAKRQMTWSECTQDHWRNRPGPARNSVPLGQEAGGASFLCIAGRRRGQRGQHSGRDAEAALTARDERAPGEQQSSSHTPAGPALTQYLVQLSRVECSHAPDHTMDSRSAGSRPSSEARQPASPAIKPVFVAGRRSLCALEGLRAFSSSRPRARISPRRRRIWSRWRRHRRVVDAIVGEPVGHGVGGARDMLVLDRAELLHDAVRLRMQLREAGMAALVDPPHLVNTVTAGSGPGHPSLSCHKYRHCLQRRGGNA